MLEGMRWRKMLSRDAVRKAEAYLTDTLKPDEWHSRLSRLRQNRPEQLRISGLTKGLRPVARRHNLRIMKLPKVPAILCAMAVILLSSCVSHSKFKRLEEKVARQNAINQKAVADLRTQVDGMSVRLESLRTQVALTALINSQGPTNDQQRRDLLSRLSTLQSSMTDIQNKLNKL